MHPIPEFISPITSTGIHTSVIEDFGVKQWEPPAGEFQSINKLPHCLENILPSMHERKY